MSKPSAEWQVYKSVPAGDLKEAVKIAKLEGDGRWKWAASPGNGRNYSVLQCNAHVDCPVLLMVKKRLNGFFLLTKHQEHTAEKEQYKRKNSCITYDEEDALKLGLDGGTKPGGVHLARTLKEMRELEEKGENPLLRKKEGEGWKVCIDTCICYVLVIY